MYSSWVSQVKLYGSQRGSDSGHCAGGTLKSSVTIELNELTAGIPCK
jgi:hypothetical protein